MNSSYYSYMSFLKRLSHNSVRVNPILCVKGRKVFLVYLFESHKVPLIIAPGFARLPVVRQQRVAPESDSPVPEPVPRGTLPPVRRRHEARGGDGKPPAATDSAAGPREKDSSGRGEGPPLFNGFPDTATSSGSRPLPHRGARRAQRRGRQLAVPSVAPADGGPARRRGRGDFRTGQRRKGADFGR